MTAAARMLIMAVVAAVGLAAGATSSPAEEHQSPLEPVWKKIAEIKYVDAAKLLNAVFRRGHLPADDLADAHRLGGEIYAALGDEGRSREHFFRWLVLEPDGDLPTGTSPKIAAPFAEARKQARTHRPLRVRHRTFRGGGTVTVGLIVDSDPLSMVAGVRVVYSAGRAAPPTERVDEPDALVTKFQVADRDWLRLRVIAIDERGNELVAIGGDRPIELAPAAAPTDSLAPGPSRGGRAWYARWYTWTGLATVAAGAGGYFALRAHSDADQLSALIADSSTHRYAEARAIENRARRNTLLANISFGATGIAAVTAIVCKLRGSPPTSGPVIEPMASPDGTAGLSLTTAF